MNSLYYTNFVYQCIRQLGGWILYHLQNMKANIWYEKNEYLIGRRRRRNAKQKRKLWKKKMTKWDEEKRVNG